MKLWLRTHAYHQCSWSVVWKHLGDGLKDAGHTVYDDHANSPDEPSKCIEIWWGNPAEWQWSGKNVAGTIGIAIAEARSIVALNRNDAIENVKQCDLLICPSEWSATAYRESPANVPVRVIWFGYDPKEMYPVNRDWDGTLKFLLAGATQFRKGTWLGIEGFIAAFGRFSNAELYIWSSVHTPDLELLQKEYGSHKKIFFQENKLKSSFDKFKEMHIMVSPHLSEGFGLMIPEAMATGMPCMVARCSSPMEYFSNNCGWWIEMSELYAPVSDCLDNTGGTWRLPDVKSIAEIMKYVNKNRDVCKRKGIAAASYAGAHLTWSNTANGIISAIEEVLDGEGNSSNTCI